MPATIFEVCPLVALLLGLKYGRLPGGTHGSSCGSPHAVACHDGAADQPVRVRVVGAAYGHILELLPVGVSPNPAALESILEICPLVALLLGRKYGRLPGGTHGSPAPPHA